MSYLHGCDVTVGGDKHYSDSATVRIVQTKLKALATASGDSSFDPGPIDGKIGPKTKSAVKAFNKAYGWATDGDKITSGTLEALKRPDVIDPQGYAEKQAAIDSVVPPGASPGFVPPLATGPGFPLPGEISHSSTPDGGTSRSGSGSGASHRGNDYIPLYAGAGVIALGALAFALWPRSKR